MTTTARVPRRRHGPKPDAKLKRYPDLSTLSAGERQLVLALSAMIVSAHKARIAQPQVTEPQR
jgi:hypothetical protein